MWKCSSCHNENKDEYRFCLQCGEPRPADFAAVKKPAAQKPAEKKSAGKAPAKPAPAKKKPAGSGSEDQNLTRTILLLAFALVLVIAVIAIIFYYPKLSGKTEPAATERPGRAEATDAPGDGSDIFIIGGETPAPAVTAPAATAPAAITPAPILPPSEAPADTVPIVTPVPTAAATAEPVGDYLIPGSDTRYVTEADLSKLTWQQCTLARNEIYARHGRKFATKEIADYFNSKSWYSGTVEAEAFSESVLSEIERSNVNYIKQYETSHWGGSYY
ncbi:MAG: YARHG domain-containing protein [Oscillospiraceae bacterium]|nr:YARHG domain-containing protein [Oscillospiraceae bacterium]